MTTQILISSTHVKHFAISDKDAENWLNTRLDCLDFNFAKQTCLFMPWNMASRKPIIHSCECDSQYFRVCLGLLHPTNEECQLRNDVHTFKQFENHIRHDTLLKWITMKLYYSNVKNLFTTYFVYIRAIFVL